MRSNSSCVVAWWSNGKLLFSWVSNKDSSDNSTTEHYLLFWVQDVIQFFKEEKNPMIEEFL